MAERRSVVVGETTHEIQPFRAFKGELALALVKSVTGEMQKLLVAEQEFVKKWQEDNPLQVTREVCGDQISRFKAMAETARELGKKAPETSDEEDVKTVRDYAVEAHFYDGRVQSWEGQKAALGDKPYIEVPNADRPPFQEVVLALFPQAMDTMPGTVKLLLALVVIPNKDLRQYDIDDDWEKELKQLGKELFHEGTIGEMIELAAAAAAAIEAEITASKVAAGKLRSLFDRLTGKQKRMAQEAKATRTGETTSTNDSQDESSSSSSVSDSDGPETTSSMEPVGANPST